MNLIEIQIDRIVGPTHHFGGLGVGNVASKTNAGEVSNPAAAALQGLDKMRLVAQLGVPQLILPPQTRPASGMLQSLGFRDSQWQKILDESPELFSGAMSSSAMWTANAATVTPAIDNQSNQLMMTIANLTASLHRSIEPSDTEQELTKALGCASQISPPIAVGSALRDEGAANHMRLGTSENTPGINVFVYGDGDPMPKEFWPRQSRAACEAIARSHQLSPENTFFLKQHPEAIDAGAFHNDVVAMSHHNLFVHHELAYWEAGETLQQIEKRYEELNEAKLNRIEISQEELSIADAVSTYLFNSQIVSPPDSRRPEILCPSEVREHDGAKKIVRDLCQRGLFREACYVALNQSMSGGGGPACLRLRIPMSMRTFNSVPKLNQWSEDIDEQLRSAIERHYPTEITLEKLADPSVLAQAENAALAIQGILLGQRSQGDAQQSHLEQVTLF
jgi:succinylarginine dihydrolase